MSRTPFSSLLYTPRRAYRINWHDCIPECFKTSSPVQSLSAMSHGRREGNPSHTYFEEDEGHDDSAQRANTILTILNYTPEHEWLQFSSLLKQSGC